MADMHQHDASAPGEEQLRHALRRLADTAVGTPPLSGAEVRALAGRRRGRLVVVPAVALAGLLVGTTAYALAGGFSAGHRSPTNGTPPPASMPLAPGRPHGSSAAGSGRTRTAPGPAGSAVPARPPTARTASHAPRPPLPAPARLAACVTVRRGEFLVALHKLSIPDALATGTGAATDPELSAVRISCVRGRLVPSGSLQRLAAAPDAVVTTTAPLSAGSAPTPSTLEEAALGLARHPDQFFGVRRDASGQVTRLDEVYVR